MNNLYIKSTSTLEEQMKIGKATIDDVKDISRIHA